MGGPCHGSAIVALLVMAVCVPVIAVSRPQTAEPATASPSRWLADGIWIVQARAPGNQHCTDRLVRLSNKQGRLSGALAFARASVPIRNLMLPPDGSILGATRARLTDQNSAALIKLAASSAGIRSALPLKVMAAPSPRHRNSTGSKWLNRYAEGSRFAGGGG
jgi:hypothetical protein